jgi:uncharacterized protein (DUF1330 family)
MKRYMTIGLSILAGAGFGGIAVQSLFAQVKPAAYVIAEVTVNDQDAYAKEFLPARAKAIADSGGRYIVRGGKAIAVKGTPPAGRVIVVQFENIDSAQVHRIRRV